MPLIAQICMVIVTIALVAMAVMTIRLMFRTKALLESAKISLAELPALIEEIKGISARTDELLLAFTRITGSVHVAASHLEHIATRTGTLASSLLDEVERPVSRAVRVMRALRCGASYLVDRWTSPVASDSHTQQGEDNVGEQPWLDGRGIPAGSGDRRRPGADLRANGR
jgi:uncharacterized protein YoxC